MTSLALKMEEGGHEPRTGLQKLEKEKDKIEKVGLRLGPSVSRA